MLELHDAGRRLATFRAGTPTPLAAIQRRARHRQRRRRAVGGGAGGVLVAVLVVAGLHLVPSHAAQSVTVRATPSTTVAVTHALTPPPAVTAPKGWSLQEIGLLAFDTPNWASSRTKSEYTTGPQAKPCHDSRCTIIPDLLARASIPTTGLTRTSIHGLTVWETTKAPVHVYDIPSTGIELLLRGPDASRIARTLQPSAAADVLAAHYPLTLPADWKTVTYDGVTLQVPPTWTIRHPARTDRAAYGSGGCSVPAGSAIYLGPFSAACFTEPAAYPSGPWLWLGHETGRHTKRRRPLFKAHQSALVHTSAPGVRITLSYGGPYGPRQEPPRALTIRTATGTLYAQVGISQSTPVLEEEILSSIQQAS